MEAGPSKPMKKRGSREIMSTELVAVFDRCKISDRKVVYILIAVVDAFELDVKFFVNNNSTIHRYHENRKKLRRILKKIQIIRIRCCRN